MKQELEAAVGSTGAGLGVAGFADLRGPFADGVDDLGHGPTGGLIDEKFGNGAAGIGEEPVGNFGALGAERLQ